MERQKSIVQFTGCIGNPTFHETKDGFMARQRTSGLTKAQIEFMPPQVAPFFEQQPFVLSPSQLGRIFTSMLNFSSVQPRRGLPLDIERRFKTHVQEPKKRL